MMTRIYEIRARLDKATPGPWEPQGFDTYPGDEGTPIVGSDGGGLIAYALRHRMGGGSGADWYDEEQCNKDADLIANAPADLAWCLGEIERLAARVAWYEPRYHARSMALIKIRGLARQSGLPEIQGLANEALTTAH